ncbi:MAG: hypothetical protein U1E05_20220, partial [Patescibacteria group bacterium]|nr:hypothetical protein [Patescibacteria group bacterium]
FVQDATKNFPGESDEFHHYYKLVCDCGSQRFLLHQSNRKSVVASCRQCGREIIVYDLSNYAAACKVAGEEHLSPMASADGATADVTVFVMYEYGEIDDDQEFDRNDVTWCQVFVEDASGTHVCVFDDETA